LLTARTISRSVPQPGKLGRPPGGWDLVWLFSQNKERSPKTSDGLRIYAIGDVHGCADLLAQLHACIDADIAVHPAPQVLEVMLGDYIDRGPDSRTVLELLISRSRSHQIVCLKGNHETFIFDFLRDPVALDPWKSFGGLETLMSYGLVPPINADNQQQRELAEAFAHALPNSHRQFLFNLSPSFTTGDYFFAHAGVRPGIPLMQQKERDLLWIREEFLGHKKAFGKIVIHGHTPVVAPDIRPNRINIDTGAYATGRLTCLVLEDEQMRFI
jgi:serine/threonine protein phosphatase 1